VVSTEASVVEFQEVRVRQMPVHREIPCPRAPVRAFGLAAEKGHRAEEHDHEQAGEQGDGEGDVEGDGANRFHVESPAGSLHRPGVASRTGPKTREDSDTGSVYDVSRSVMSASPRKAANR